MSTSVRWVLAHAIYLMLIVSTLITADAQTKPTPPKPPSENLALGEEPYHNVWGVDVLLSNGGFGLGTFYLRALTPDLSGIISLSISESKDPREVQQFDYFGTPYTPGKLNRFLVLPLTVGIQYRLFREEIVETFRPYITAGVGPALIYEMPYATVDTTTYPVTSTIVDFFKAIGKGHSHYTATAYVGAGANVGGSQSNVFGVNFRYYFTYLFSKGIPSLFNVYTGETSSTMKDFGGFFITVTVGLGY